MNTTHSNKCEKCQHSSAESSPVLFITSLLFITKNIITNYSKESHQHGKKDHHIEYRVPNSVNQCCNKNLKAFNEGDGP